MSYNQVQNHMPHQQYHNQLPQEMMSAKEQTMMWQQNSYLCDSGINSGASSQVPSLCGHEDNGRVENDPSMFDQGQGYTQNYAQGPVDNMNAQMSQNCSQHVPSALYSESVDEGIDIPSTPYNEPQQSTADQRLSELTKMLNHAVNNLIQCQDDTYLVVHVMPELVKSLNDEDNYIVSNAAIMVHKLSRIESSRHAIIQNNSMICALVHAISASSDLETTKGAVGILNNLSQHLQGLEVIFKCDGIPALVKLLSSPIESVLFYAITTLHNLLLHQKGSKAAVRMSGGLQKMVQLLQRNNLSFLVIVTDCLQILALCHQESKLIILACGGSSELVRIMRSNDHEKLLWTTSRVLKILSTCSSNKPAIIAAGGIQVFTTHLANKSPRLVQNCLWTLRNLSDAATRIDGLDMLLRSLVQHLGSQDIHMVTCAAGILSNLTANNQRNKQIVCQMNGVEALINTIVNAGDHEEIIEPSVCALRHLTINHELAEMAQVSVLNYGIQIALKLLNNLSRWQLIKAVIGLIRNISVSQANHAILREQNVIHCLVHLLNRAQQNIQRVLMAGNGPQQPEIDAVRTEEIVENTVAVLHILAKDSHNKVLIRQLNAIPTFVALLSSGRKNTQRVAVGVLCELVADKESVGMIEAAGAILPITDLLHSGNETIVTDAKTILFQMREAKSTEYQKCQSVELTNTLRDDMAWTNDIGIGLDLQDMLGADQAYEGLYGQSTVSANSSHGGRIYQHGNQAYDNLPMPINALQGLEMCNPSLGGPTSPYEMDMDIGEIGAGELLELMPSPSADNQAAAWYDSNL